MYNVTYEDGSLNCNSGFLVNIREPFHRRLDRRVKKCSMEKLMVHPDDTRNCSQFRRFTVPMNSNIAYSMHVAYKNELKSQAVYVTNFALTKMMRSKILKYVSDNMHMYEDLKSDLLAVIRQIIKSWEFDGLITDMPWLVQENLIQTTDCSGWMLTRFRSSSRRDRAMNLILEAYGGVPLGLLSYNEMSKVSIEDTSIPLVEYKCPLVITRSNAAYSAYLSNTLNRGLPVTLFKISTSE